MHTYFWHSSSSRRQDRRHPSQLQSVALPTAGCTRRCGCGLSGMLVRTGVRLKATYRDKHCANVVFFMHTVFSDPYKVDF